ncbi:MAG: 1-phosphofructokinase [Actinomycetota bacterium]|jgi:1-phosphofructokinase family hexose kinase|nr:1-phosphofructokinase [Actinomycetota bacterium]
MIATLTPNPSVDRTVSITDLQRGEVHRATTHRVDPGGKGVNISRALTAHQARTIAVLPAGGPEGNLLAELLAEAGIPVAIVPIDGSTRANIALVEPDGTTTKINEPGPLLSPEELEALLAGAVNTLTEQPRWLVGSGSLPPGVDDILYAGLVRRCREAGVKVAIDASGPPLRLAVEAGPDLIKPNLEELEELVGRSLNTLAEVLDAATDLLAQGVGTVVVSLGSAGALLVSPGLTAHAVAAVSAPLSTVGAGDALLAGYLYATGGGSTAVQALCTGVAWGAAAVSLPGSRMPTPADVAGIQVSVSEEPELTLTLKH